MELNASGKIILFFDCPINSEMIYLSTKLTNKKMYGECPKRILPYKIDKEKVFFDISKVISKYGLQFEIKSHLAIIPQGFGENIQVISTSPIQFKLDWQYEKKFNYCEVDKNQNIIYSGDNTILALKRVKQQIAYEHYPNISKIEIVNGFIKIDFQKLIKDLSLSDRDIIDIYEVNNVGEKAPLKVNGSLTNEWISIPESNDQAIIYKTKKGNLGLRFAVKDRLSILEIGNNNEELKFCLSSDANIEHLYLADTSQSKELSNKRYLREIIFKKNRNNLFISTSELLKNPETQFHSVTQLVYSNNTGTLLRTIKFITSQLKLDTPSLSILVDKNFLEEAVIFLKLIETKKGIRVAVLGSSHTRPMFTSTKYFNPEYKQLFKVVYTQFHSSIRSISDSRKVAYMPQYFEKEHPVAQGYIKTDFQKTFFEELCTAKPEVLVIDIYIDIQMGVFEFPNGVISYNTYQAKNNYIAEVDSEVKLSTIENDPNYIEKFKKALIYFKNKVTEIISEDKIILHLIDMNYEYLTNDGNIKKHNQTEGSITTLNYNALSLQSILVEVFSNSYILDSRDSGFCGKEDMPLGNTPHHYQSEYYKKMLGDFAQVLLKLKN